MNKRTKMLIVNYVMAVSLVIVMVTGMLLRPFPGMWMGIAHGVSGMLLTASIVVHCIQHRPKRKKSIDNSVD